MVLSFLVVVFQVYFKNIVLAAEWKLTVMINAERQKTL
jgi:hypothetical protein